MQVSPTNPVRFYGVLLMLIIGHATVGAQKSDIEAQFPTIVFDGNRGTTDLQGYFVSAFDLYIDYISPIDGDHRCSFYPTCSRYSRQAFDKYGYYYGALLTFDRLIRCGYDRGPKIIIERQILIYDPVSNNVSHSRQ